MIVASAIGLALGVPAFASHPEVGLPGSEFEIDANANLKLDDLSPAIDWASVTETRQEDEPTGSNDDSFGQGAKEDTAVPTVVDGSIPNNKSDLLDFGVHQEENANGKFLHLFWTRVQEPSGTTNMDFELNQSTMPSANGVTPVRTAGDILITYDLTQGGSVPVISVREWSGTAWGPAQVLSGPPDPNDPPAATGSINSTPIPAGESDGLGALSARTFGEATINLDFIFDPDTCTSFGSAYLKSRSSDSFTAALKDFIAPVPVNITNCGKVIIRKQTIPDEEPATTSFGFTKSFGTDPATSNTFSLRDDEAASFSNVLFGSGYTVTENEMLPAGWTFDHIDCSASTGVTPSITGDTVTFDIDEETDTLDCTFYNRAPGTIIVEKVTSDGTGTFAFSSSTLPPGSFTLTTTATGAAGKDSRAFSNLDPGTYDVAEAVPAGWNLTGATCSDGSNPASIGLGAGETVTCTFTNARERGAIRLIKTRKHAADGPGDHAHPGVTFVVTGPELPVAGVEIITDADGEACLGDLLVGGDYTVTEIVPTGYRPEGETAKTVTVDSEATCDAGNGEMVSFSNIPLTNLTVSVDSQVDGGTASVITCTGPDTSATASTGPSGDGSLSVSNRLPGTYTCVIEIDP